MTGSTWAAESFGQLCIGFLTLHTHAELWPDAAADLDRLRDEIVTQVRQYRDDPVFFDYLAGRATLRNGCNGLDGRGLTLALRAFALADLAAATEPPLTFDDWQHLVETIVGDPPTALAA